jgi:hypothetical protein
MHTMMPAFARPTMIHEASYNQLSDSYDKAEAIYLMSTLLLLTFSNPEEGKGLEIVTGH